MPGMMDTILNLGLNDKTVEGLKTRTKNGPSRSTAIAASSRCSATVVLEIPKDAFEHEFEAVKKSAGAKLDTDLDEKALRDVVERYKKIVKKKSGRDFPQDPTSS